VTLPAAFDGYAFLPYESFGFVSTSFGNSEFNNASIFAIYIGINTMYDAFSDYSLGDIEVVYSDNTTLKILDLSTITALDFGNKYIKDYLGDNVNFTRLSGYEGEEEVPAFDYS
jgi:hypothetical protein